MDDRLGGRDVTRRDPVVRRLYAIQPQHGSEPRDFIDLAELTKRFPLEELIGLATEKDPGLDLAVLDEFTDRAGSLPQADFELDDGACQGLLATVSGWRTQIRLLREQQPTMIGARPTATRTWGSTGDLAVRSQHERRPLISTADRE